MMTQLHNRPSGIFPSFRMRLAVPVLFLAMLPLGWLDPAPAQSGNAWKEIRKDFLRPPLSRQSRPLWFWNGALTAEKTREILLSCKKKGYYGVGILPGRHMSPSFMSAEFLDQYRIAVEQAADLEMKLCLYDEYWFPSGSAGDLLARRYPEALSRRLDMQVLEIEGPREVIHPLPKDGTLMGIVAMHSANRQRIDLSSRSREGYLRWEAPSGNWKILFFSCVRDGAKGLVDYLNPDAVRRFIELTYEAYYRQFPSHFGTTIDSAFYDEPTFHWVEGGRAWTDNFNARFQEKYGYHPILYYPALWFDIGPETAAARNALFGFRAELYATGFPKSLTDWCHQHRLQLTGHVDQEEVVNPVGLCGDLMQALRHQDIPGIDQIFRYGRASKVYKIVSSVAYNYDRQLVMSECYGAVKDMPPVLLYKEAMDQFAKGINVMVPHAVWYDSEKVIYPPDLSPGNPIYGPHLEDYNRYIGRLQRLLQEGRHVADIAVLYPIAGLQAGYHFGPGKPYDGGVIPPEADYMDLGELLSLEVRHDFTFLHPEVLEESCTVDGKELHLGNRLHDQRYKAIFLPGARAISWRSLQKIRQFFDQGGTVIATTMLPRHSAEFGKDREVRQTIAEMFGQPEDGIYPEKENLFRTGPNGGKAYFLASLQASSLRTVLKETLPVPDVDWEKALQVTGGNLSYIHKVVQGRDLYFFANSSDQTVQTMVRLRGRHRLQRWDPHTGKTTGIEALKAGPDTGGDSAGVTRFQLQLPANHSAFYISLEK